MPRYATQTRAAKYRTLVVIEKPTDTVEGIGGPDLDWSKYAERWASIAPSNGREYQNAMAIIADLAAIVRLRYDTLTRDITPRMRIKRGNRLWNIASVANDGEQNREMVLYCTEVVA